MTSVAFSAQGSCDLSSGQVVFKFNIPELVNQGSFTLLSQQLNKESQEVVILQKPSLHFCHSALGVMGGVALIVSCLASVLLPAIASMGVIGIAYLARRKAAPLHAKKLLLDSAKAQSSFQNMAENKESTNNSQPLLNHLIPVKAKDTLAQNKPPPPPPPPPLPGFPMGSEIYNLSFGFSR
ncbi:MAG: hypothetical protein ACRDDW_00545 [Candidatus Rhabdochlamydia sp.]